LHQILKSKTKLFFSRRFIKPGLAEELPFLEKVSMSGYLNSGKNPQKILIS